MISCGVIIPVHGRVTYLEDALKSVYNQTHIPEQVIIISERLLPSYIDDYLYIPGFSVVYTQCDTLHKVNLAVRDLNTDAMLVLCDDDMLHPEYVEKTLQDMEDSGCDIVYTDMQMIGKEDKIVKASEWKVKNFENTTVPFLTSLIKVFAWNRVGGYDASVYFVDWNFWWSCFDYGCTAHHLEEPLFIYRVHAGSYYMWMNVEKSTRECQDKHKERMEHK